MPFDSTFLPLRPKFTYGVGGSIITYQFKLPQRAWTQGEATIGGRRVAAGGVGASHIVRADELLVVPLRFYESEWPNLVSLVAWGQTEELFTFEPDTLTVPLTTFSVYLHTPAAGTRMQPTRSGLYPKVLEFTIELRRADLPETPWNIDYFGAL